MIIYTEMFTSFLVKNYMGYANVTSGQKHCLPSHLKKGIDISITSLIKLVIQNYSFV